MPSVTKVIRDHGEILEPGEYYAPFNLLHIEEGSEAYNPDKRFYEKYRKRCREKG